MLRIQKNALRKFASGRPRPISPHVTIYKFPINAIGSIMNRATRVGLSAG